MIRWCGDGLEKEADLRQVEKLVDELELEGPTCCVTPEAKPLPEQLAEDQPLSPDRHTMFRSLAARANYLSADRSDCLYAAKDIRRWMSAPTELSMLALKLLGRYLLARPRLAFRSTFQSAGTVYCYSDTDWAGCPKTRKSTSGGVILLGQHMLNTYSPTQPAVSLWSGVVVSVFCLRRCACIGSCAWSAKLVCRFAYSVRCSGLDRFVSCGGNLLAPRLGSTAPY